jgi:hypothetical protein
MGFSLVIDHRETKVTSVMHIALEHERYSNIRHELKELKKGDYAIVHKNSIGGVAKVVAIIERKELSDYAASLKDGRHNNKDKLFEARNKTGCKIYYLIEGNMLSDKKSKYGRIPFEYIESSITALMVRDGIHVIYSRDQLHSCERLFDLVNCYARIMLETGEVSLDRSLALTLGNVITGGNPNPVEAGDTDEEELKDNEATETTEEPKDIEDPNAATDSTLFEASEKTVAQMAMNMWQCIGGVAVTLSGELTKICPIYGLRGADTVLEIQDLHYSNGRKVNKRTIDNINEFHRMIRKPLTSLGSKQKKLVNRVLCCVINIGPKTADILLSTYSLYTLSSLTDEIIIAKVGKKGAKIIEALNYISE